MGMDFSLMDEDRILVVDHVGCLSDEAHAESLGGKYPVVVDLRLAVVVRRIGGPLAGNPDHLPNDQV